MNTNAEYHYVYRITNLSINKHYYGSRSSKIHPSLDLGKKYFSSSTDKSFIKDQKENPQNYKYKIIKIYTDDRTKALSLEVKLHLKFNVATNPNFLNKARQTVSGFTHKNRVSVIDKSTGITTSIAKDDFDKLDNYVGATIGKTTIFDNKTKKYISIDKNELKNYEDYRFSCSGLVYAFDKNSGIRKWCSTDEFNNNSDLEFHTKNRVTVRNKITGKTEFVTKEEFYSNENLEHTAKNTVVAKNKKTGEVTRVAKSIFDSSDEWVSLNLELGLANIIEIYNIDGEMMLRYEGNFENQSKLDKIPYAEFRKSYKSGGEHKLYQSIIDGTAKKDLISRLTNNGNIKYAGWYAKVIK